MKLKGYYKEVYDRLRKLRETNPRWEMVFREKSCRDRPDYAPVVGTTMTILPDGTIAYLYDAGEPHPKDPRVTKAKVRKGALYNELLFAVGRKFPGETRHQTALRYIREAEASAVRGPSAMVKAVGQGRIV